MQGTEPQTTPFFHLGLCWEVEPQFFTDDYRTLTNPSARTLEDVVLGPFCPNCQRNLRTEVKGSWMSAGAGRLYKIVDPCSCGQRVPKSISAQPHMTFDDLLNEVWQEAQRLVRAKRPLPTGTCGQEQERRSGEPTTDRSLDPEIVERSDFTAMATRNNAKWRAQSYTAAHPGGRLEKYTVGQLLELPTETRHKLLSDLPDLARWWKNLK